MSAMQAIRRTGTGTPVVFVHGFCQSAAFWAPTMALLDAPGLAVDLPGFAGTPPPPQAASMEYYADALAAELDTQGWDRIVLVGGSMGGVVAQHVALRHPARITRLLLVATGAYTADPAGALAKADALEAGPWNTATTTPIVAGFFHKPLPPTELLRFSAIAANADHATAVQAARANARSRTLERLAEIAVPVLIIQGQHDRARTPAHGAEMQALLPEARLAILEGAGHTPQLEEADAFHAFALPFLHERS